MTAENDKQILQEIDEVGFMGDPETIKKLASKLSDPYERGYIEGSLDMRKVAYMLYRKR